MTIENQKLATDLSYAIAGHSADETVSYKTVAGECLWLGYFFPKDFDRRKKYPVFFMIHGGGWGTRKIFADQAAWQGDYLGYLARYYAENGFLAVSIDYRLIRNSGQEEDYGIMEVFEDCHDAVEYAVFHAKDYCMDTSDMYLLGESAGGHLAGMLATSHDRGACPFQKVILVNPITDMHLDSWRNYVPFRGGSVRLERLCFEERLRFLSPLYRIDENTCETILIHGREDTTVSPQHSVLYYNRMRELSCRCSLHLIEDTTHAFLLPEYYKGGMGACAVAIHIIDRTVGRGITPYTEIGA